MRVIREGHQYVLDGFEQPVEGSQYLQFIEKEPIKVDSAELRTVNDGTTNEEVFKVLIDRMQYLQAKFPCRENAIVITNLEESLMWLEKRTRDREARGVEGKNQK